MLLDLLVGIAASLIASGIVGFLGNKAISKKDNNISKKDNIILKIYILFLSAVTFIVSIMISIILNQDIIDRISIMTEASILKFYSNCINSFILIFGIFAFVSAVVIFVEALDRGARRDHKEDMDRYRYMKK